nr:nitronate monooxygenase [Streptomyces parvus]
MREMRPATATATRAEHCVIACAEAWRGDGDIVASPMGAVPSVGARQQAEKAAAWGADAVIVQGGEGGGTRAVATTVLLPQVVDAVDIPVIAAGGFHDGRGLVAALAYGAAGAAMVEGRTDLGIMASGQVAALIEDLPSVAGLVERVMADAERSLMALGAMTGRPGA